MCLLFWGILHFFLNVFFFMIQAGGERLCCAIFPGSDEGLPNFNWKFWIFTVTHLGVTTENIKSQPQHTKRQTGPFVSINIFFSFSKNLLDIFPFLSFAKDNEIKIQLSFLKKTKKTISRYFF